MTRRELDATMRSLLAKLELISSIPASNYDNSHGTDDDPGGRRPPGDYGYRTYAAWYGPPFHESTSEHPGCNTDPDREACIDATRRELEHLRKGQHVQVDEPAAQDSIRKQMLEETAGWSLQDVACSHWRVNITLLRRLRVADGRDSETGQPVLHDKNGQDLASRARDLKNSGMSIRAIGMALGVHSYQVQRLLKKVA